MSRLGVVGIVILAVIIIVGGGVVLAMRKTPTASTGSGGSAVPSNGKTMSVSINANDDSASQTSVSTTKGTTVNLTFNVESSGVYHGGLEFESTDPKIDSGGIKPGASKTVTFVASKSFEFTPYWYQSGVKKDYMIAVNVQ